MKSALRLGLGVLLSSHALGQLPLPAVPKENPITPEKVVLGKALFWDEQLSSDSTIACGTCHIPAAGGSDPRSGADVRNPGPDGILGTRDDRFGSFGVARQDAAGDFVPDELFRFERQIGGRASATPIGAAYFDELFWDGRAPSYFVDPASGQTLIANGAALESQALQPFLNPMEMAHEGRTIEQVVERVESVVPLALAWELTPDLEAAVAGAQSYGDLFQRAFGTPEVTATRIAFAIATYERALVPDQTPWDKYMNGDLTALTPNQLEGFDAFWDFQARCIACHLPPLFSDGSYRNIGRRPIDEDRGRFAVSQRPEDRGTFKIPTLRNAGLRPRLFHDGGLPNVLAAVEFYNATPLHWDNLDPEMDPIGIPPHLVRPVADFVANGLTDMRVANELPPFDRPKLNSERAQPGPEILGGAEAGSGGFEPALIALSPTKIGNQGFKLGVHDALGGATAVVGVTLGAPGTRPWTRAATMRLAGSGAGEGYGTFRMPIPNDPNLIGQESWLQFWVLDPGAASGFAKSPIAHLTIF